MRTSLFTTAAALAALAAAAGPAKAQVTSYDGATAVVTIPTVSVGAATYANVTLKNIGNFVFDLLGATEQKPASPGVGRYDGGTSVLTLPAVRVGDATYIDVTLVNTGNFRFALQTATELPAATLNEVKSLLASLDALWAGAVPASAALRVSLLDECYLHDGRTKAWLQADATANLFAYQQRDQYQVGRRSTNLQVLAVRNSLNAGGTARREIDVQYDVEYNDGTSSVNNKQTFLSGSSMATPGCAAPQTSAALRFFGNRQLVSTAVRGRTMRDERYVLANNAAAASPLVRYRREVRLQVTDPLANADYVVVTGPGPNGTVASVTVPFSMKMVSPFIMRAAPEFLGKSGNYVNFMDDDGFRYCNASDTTVPVAPAADCAGLGAGSDNWGFTSTNANAGADQSFAADGWVAGGVYRFDVYKDNGWKTINGHANKTPIATYFNTLDDLPFTFVEVAGSGANPNDNDRFAHLRFGGMAMPAVQANFLSATPSVMDVSWNAQPVLAGARKLGLLQTWHYFQGPKVGNTGSNLWPALRSIDYSYPGSAATSLLWPVLGKPLDMSSKTYTEFVLFFTDRNDRVLQSRVLFQ